MHPLFLNDVFDSCHFCHLFCIFLSRWDETSIASIVLLVGHILIFHVRLSCLFIVVFRVNNIHEKVVIIARKMCILFMDTFHTV